MPERSSGLSIMSLPDLPPAEQAILKFLLRRGSSSESTLRAGLTENRVSESEIALALDHLEKKQWLKKTKKGNETIYSVVMAQRSSNNLTDVNLHRRSSTSSIASVFHMLESTEEPAKPVAVPKPRGGTIFFVLIALGIVNSFVLGVLDVVAISGFVTELGTRNLPWLWISEMVIGLLISGSYLRIIDRLPRSFMMKIVLGFLVFIYAIIFGLFALGISTQILYP